MSLRDVRREFREVPLTSVDPPTTDARMERDPEKLEELAGDIAKRGVILPLAVVAVDGRYEIVDGFCRFLAATRAGLATVPCLIYPTKDTALEGVKYAANLFRLDMSAAEEATFFHALFEHECGQDIDRVCALVNKKRSYVDARLQLVLGDEEVFAAVLQKQIQLGVAAELNKLPDQEWRRYYLRHAIKSGATVSLVTGWVNEWRTMYEREQAPRQSAPSLPEPAIVSSYDPRRCYICGDVHPQHVPEQVAIHTHCKLAILDPMLRAYHGQPAATE